MTNQGLTGSRERQALLSNLRHDLRSPVNAIVGYSEMLLEEQEDQNEQAFCSDLQNIQLLGRQILSSINATLSPTELTTTQPELDIVSLGRIVRTQLETPLDSVIRCCNLLLKVIPADLVTDVEKIRTAAEQLLTLLSESALSQIQQQENSVNRTISLTLGHDRTVLSTLEQRTEEQTPLLATGQLQATAAQAQTTDMPQSSILVVDDNPEIRDLLSRRLEKQGYTTASTASGYEALQMLETGSYDLVLLDIVMPELNGYEILDRLKTNDACRHIPAIMISGLDEIDSVIRCIERGAEDYLTKPFNPVLLKARIEACLEKKRLREQEIMVLNERLKAENARLNQLNAQLQVEMAERQQSEAKEREKSQQLTQTLQQLQHTQAQLVQSEKMSSLGQMVAGVAHEINNPINFIHGNLSYASEYIHNLLQMLALYQEQFPVMTPAIAEESEALDLEFLQEDLPKMVSSMQVGTERIREIVRSLRVFSRSDQSQKKITDLHECINSTLMILANRLKAHAGRPTIQVVKEYGNLPTVECYAGQISQVFMNIIANAIDALEEAMGEWEHEEDKKVHNSKLVTADNQLLAPKIRIRTEPIENNWVAVRIADNGPGMDETVQKQLFDPFFTMKPAGKGTGIGMSISYEIVNEKHGGRLYCTSTPGEGAEFSIEIPVS